MFGAGCHEKQVGYNPAIEAVAKRRVLTVSQVNRLVAGMLGEFFADVWIEGEVTNLKRYPSGHLYFALKDEESQIQAACFRPNAARLAFELEDGLLVVGHGRLEVYARTGKYQAILDAIEPKGLGALQKAFEQLKRKLEREGLFAEERKRPIPALPRVVGIVTSPVGAAVHDMLQTLRLHRARVKVLLFPAQVQGGGAAEQIAQGIAELNSRPGTDVIIVGRGGGSIEDLWPFNEEIVARQIAASRLPVVTGIGHEVDFTIADFVADVRAATPTAAAQLVARGWGELEERLRNQAAGLVEALHDTLFAAEQRLDELARHRGFESFALQMREAGHHLERVVTAVESKVKAELGSRSSRINRASEQLAQQNPSVRILRQQSRLEASAVRIRELAREKCRSTASILRQTAGRADRPTQLLVQQFGERLSSAAAKLDALGPLASLGRGYSICTKPDGAIVSRVGQVRPGEAVAVRVTDGAIGCRVEKAEPGQKGS